MNQTCSSCVNFDPREVKVNDVMQQAGVCRAHPPQRFAADDVASRFPYTTPDNWCGEYKSNPDKDRTPTSAKNMVKDAKPAKPEPKVDPQSQQRPPGE
jgi:hypothetical protein